MTEVGIDTSVLIGLLNDALIALSCHHREIPFIASFDRDFDNVAWLHRLATPDDLHKGRP